MRDVSLAYVVKHLLLDLLSSSDAVTLPQETSSLSSLIGAREKAQFARSPDKEHD
jgi:hypothetical protein